MLFWGFSKLLKCCSMVFLIILEALRKFNCVVSWVSCCGFGSSWSWNLYASWDWSMNLKWGGFDIHVSLWGMNWRSGCFVQISKLCCIALQLFCVLSTLAVYRLLWVVRRMKSVCARILGGLLQREEFSVVWYYVQDLASFSKQQLSLLSPIPKRNTPGPST